MQNILTNKTASVTEFREPNKVIEEAGDSAVAIMNRNKVLGYFVPASSVDLVDNQLASRNEVLTTLQKRKVAMDPVNSYLKDK